MRLQCWYCHKAVTTDLPDDAIFRAIAVCPECLAGSPEAEGHRIDEKECEHEKCSEKAQGSG